MDGKPEKKFVLTFALSEKPRRAKFADDWPKSTEENTERLASCGKVLDRGVPLCENCGGESG
jgi:hypothetical protein